MTSRRFPNRILYGILMVSTLVGSWLGMQAVHEFGHVVGAGLTGGRVARVVLHPLTISRTDLAVNPQPAVVAWAGPVLGVLVPLLLWGIAAALRMPGAFVLRFFAGFCLIANGAYLAAGAWTGIGDAAQLMQHGVPAWNLWLFGVPAVIAGLGLWHRQGRHFGLGRGPDAVHPGVVWGTGIACSLLVLLGLLLAGPLPLHDSRSPGQPTAEAAEQHPVAAANPAFPIRFVQRQRHAAGRSVPVAIQVDDHPVALEAEPVDGGVDDAGVCLVEDDQVQVVGAQPCVMQDVEAGVDQHADRPLEDGPALHVDEVPSGGEELRREGLARPACRLTKPAIRIALRTQRERCKALFRAARSQQHRPAPVAKQRIGPLVRRIHAARHQVHAHDQRPLAAACLDPLRRAHHRVHEPRTGGIHLQRRCNAAQPLLQQAGRRRHR